jgi:hypothetical protein
MSRSGVSVSYDDLWSSRFQPLATPVSVPLHIPTHRLPPVRHLSPDPIYPNWIEEKKKVTINWKQISREKKTDFLILC